jgi:hypothetical protein
MGCQSSPWGEGAEGKLQRQMGRKEIYVKEALI